jgi:hypothetical protein
MGQITDGGSDRDLGLTVMTAVTTLGASVSTDTANLLAVRSQLAGEAIVGLDDRGHLDRGDPPVLYDDPTVDHRVARLLRRAEQDGRDRVVERASIIYRVQSDAEEIGAHPGG